MDSTVRDKELNQLNASLVGKMVEETTPPPEGLIPKLTAAILEIITPEGLEVLRKHCEEENKSYALEIAKLITSRPREERRRLCKVHGIPWKYLSR